MVAQHFTTPAIADGKVVYAKYWNYGGYVMEKSRSTSIVAVTVGNIKTVLKEVPVHRHQVPKRRKQWHNNHEDHAQKYGADHTEYITDELHKRVYFDR